MALGDTEYVFKHALTQEVAYNSLLIERRKLIHERAGKALEANFAGQLDDHLTQLAHHYSHSDNLDKAIEYLGRAGNQALQRSVHADAVINLTSAVDLLQKLPESPARIRRELALQLAMIPAFNQVKGWGSAEVEGASARSQELCEQLGDPPELFYMVQGTVCGVHFIRAELRAALEGSRQLLQRAEASKNPVPLLYAHFILGETLFHMGDLPLARKHHEAALSLDV
jgi:predicted ATPase